MSFDSDNARLSEHVVGASARLRLPDGWSLSISAGGIVDGALYFRGRTASLAPGWSVGVATAWNALEEDGAVPFVDLSLALAAAGTAVQTPGGDERLQAFDLRLGVTTGWTLFEVWRPHLAARVFGGPVIWHGADARRVGSDRYHVQLAVGSSVQLPAGFSLFAEFAPGFERAVSAGVAASF